MNRRTFLATSAFAASAVLSRAEIPRHKEPPHLKTSEIVLPPRFPHIEKEMEKNLVGVKMVCIDDSFSDDQIAKCDVFPVRGHVYTIRALRVAFRSKKDEYHLSLLFDEIVNTRLIFGREPGFWATRFQAHYSDDDEGDVQLAN